MSTLRTSGGRALPILLIALAVGAIVFLFVGDFFGTSGGAGSGDGDGGEAADMMDGDADEGARDDLDGGGVKLAGLYGDGDLGAVTLRLLWIGTKDPVADQEVKLINRKGTETIPVVSDGAGRVVFPEVIPGKGYSLSVSGEAFADVMLRGITVRKGATHDLGDMMLGDHVVLRGRVIDESGKAVANSAVSVYSGGTEMNTDGVMFIMANAALLPEMPLEEAKTDPDGYFTLSSLEDGVYRVVARRGGYASKHQDDIVVATDRSAAVMTLVLGDGARVYGKVTDEDGEPLANARVMAIRDEGRRFSMRAMQREVTTTDEEGKYVLDTLARDQRYRFGVIAEGFAPLFDMGGRQIEVEEERNFVMPKGGTIEGVVTDKETGKPVADAQVGIFVGNMMQRGENNQAATTLARTDKKGKFRVENIIPGPIASAQVKAPGYVTANYSMWTQNQWPDLKAGEVNEVTAELERGGIVQGRIIAADTKQPIAGATVMLESWAAFWTGTPSTTTDSDGQYELVGVRAGEYRVLAAADGYAPPPPESEANKVTVPESGGTQSLDVELSASGTVTGVVVDVDGEPVAGVRVTARAVAEPNPEGGRGRGRGRGRGGSMSMRMFMNSRIPRDMTDEEGKFRLIGVPAGRWEVRGESEEYVSSQTKPFRIAVGETEEVELTMLSGAVMHGRVFDEGGRGLPGARVRLGNIDDATAERRDLSGWRADRELDPKVYVTDDEGRFTATNLPPGRTLVKVTKDGYVTSYKRNLRLAAGEVRTHTVALSKGEVVQGIVFGADGKPLEDARVGVTARDPREEQPEEADDGDVGEDVEPTMWSSTGEDGRFKVENVPPGTYYVVVWFASGHQGWWRDRSDNAVRGAISVPNAGDIEFALQKSEPREMGGGRGRGGR